MKFMNYSIVPVLVAAIFTTTFVRANPSGPIVQSGTAVVKITGPQLTITTSQSAVLNWQSFNIGGGETTTFQQPSSSSVVLNRILDPNPSQIFGSLQANGVVILQNQSGFYFGPNSFVKAAGLVISTAPAVPQEMGGGAFWQFNGPPPTASIINYGALKAARGGSIFLISENIENHGSLTAPGGNIGLYAGQQVLVSERPDGRGLSAQVCLPVGSIDNTGKLIANAGSIALNAKTVNQDGLIQANSIRSHNGVIELVAADDITLGNNSVLQARGGDAEASAGGQVTVKSGGAFGDSSTSQISVAGGEWGGNAGRVEISATELGAINSQIDGHANAGFAGGSLLIDPTTLTLGTTTSGSPNGAQGLNVNSAFIGFSHIDLQASQNIIVNTPWNLAQSTGVSSPGSQLTLEAGASINIANGASITGGSGWSITLEAGRDFTSANPAAVISGTGSITLSGNGSVQTQDGSITLLAGKAVTVGSGSVTTFGGGNINVTALSGSVNAGSGANGYDFLPGSYSVDPALSGISTANGGNVNITAGQDIISFLPAPNGTETDAGSGAFGSAAGNVTLNAGRNVLGHYVVANGVGTINATANAGNASTLLALSLISGNWTVNAGQNITLQEVRNPNGIFNNRGFASSPTKHLFDYAPDDFVTLTAGNSVQLLGTGLPRYNNDTFEEGIPAIYPGTLTINSGAGGVVLGNNVTLFPSPNGQLNINTTGSLVGSVAGDLAQLVMSDSGNSQYQNAADFSLSDHAAVPVHLNDDTPVQIHVGGDMDNVLVAVPKVTTITVGGNMNNSRFVGQNLNPNDVTSISVTGDIINRNDFTSVADATAPDFTIFNTAYPPLVGALASLPTLFHYDAATNTLTFQGRMTGDQLQALQNLQVEVLDQFGIPLMDENENIITQPAQFITPALAQQLYDNSQDIPLNPNTGYVLGGGGKLNISARNLDLGATAGIVSVGPRDNPALANYFTRGADINLALSGNLDMFSTTISSINGGTISVNAGGYANIGSSTFVGDNTVARGIFTVDPSDVSVVAGGNIDINGSRIAAYDGGNLTVESLHGNIDAGVGSTGSVGVEKIVVDPITREILTFEPIIPGSGILATTFPPSLNPNFPPSLNTVGNISVLTPEGNISANAGGIVQLPLNGINTSAGTVLLNAGSRDAQGNVLFVGNIDVSGSGVIGSTVDLEATGDINGLVLARKDLNAFTPQNINLTAISGGNANLGAGGELQGTVFSVGGITAGGSVIGATLQSQSISTSGLVTSAHLGFAAGTIANSTSSSLQNDETARRIATADQGNGDDDELKKKTGFGGNLPRLSKTTGRVTMILPNIP